MTNLIQTVKGKILTHPFQCVCTAESTFKIFIFQFIGVRISCDILDRKSVFALFAFSAVCKASVATFFAFFSF